MEVGGGVTGHLGSSSRYGLTEYILLGFSQRLVLLSGLLRTVVKLMPLGLPGPLL